LKLRPVGADLFYVDECVSQFCECTYKGNVKIGCVSREGVYGEEVHNPTHS
jgi:hypothetical protein